MQRYARDPRGRIFFILLWVGVPGLFVVGLDSWEWTEVVPGWSLPIWLVAFLVMYCLRYVGGVRVEGGAVHVRPSGLSRWRSMTLREVRHVRLLNPWHGIRGYWHESIDLYDDSGRRLHIPATIENCDELAVRLRGLLVGVIREKRMAEWQEHWSLRFRCPGARWMAHLLLGMVAIAGAFLGVLVWKFWRQLPELTLWFGGGTIALLVLALIPLRARLAWIGGRVELRSTGIRIRRVDFDREYPWASLTHSWMADWNRIQLDFSGKSITLPSAVEDRDVLLEFLAMGRRRALPVTPEA